MEKDGKEPKGIIFCMTCHRIVGDSFPINHHHSFIVQNEMLLKNINTHGFKFFKDTKKTRKSLAKDFPPKDEVVLKL